MKGDIHISAFLLSVNQIYPRMQIRIHTQTQIKREFASKWTIILPASSQQQQKFSFGTLISNLTWSQSEYVAFAKFPNWSIHELKSWSNLNSNDLLTNLLDANQIMVEHRYFGKSVPDSLDWNYLNIKQSAADHHRIADPIRCRSRLDLRCNCAGGDLGLRLLAL